MPTETTIVLLYCLFKEEMLVQNKSIDSPPSRVGLESSRPIQVELVDRSKWLRGRGSIDGRDSIDFGV